jgi:hypothetical protein
MTIVAHIGDQNVVAAVIYVPAVGPWYADIDCETDPDLTGRQTLSVGDVDFVGTIDTRYAGVFGFKRRFRLVAGGGGWGKVLLAKNYHADNGVQARLVAEDAAREAGERLAAFNPGASSVGRDFVRRAGAASVTLERAAGGTPWWVDYDGTTHVEARPSSSPDSGAYEIGEVDVRARLVEFACDSVGSVRVGAMLTKRLDEPMIVRSLEITVGEVFRVKAWCGPGENARTRLVDAMRAIVQRETATRLWGVWRYRVVQMSGDRYELQAVRRDAGLPDVIPCSAVPGVGGSHTITQATTGTEVLVEFVEGDPTMPVITHFAGKDGVGWLPSEAILAAQDFVRLASATADKALAVAHKTNDNLETLRSNLSGHTHAAGTYATAMGGGVVMGISGPAALIGSLGDVGSSKVMGVD